MAVDPGVVGVEVPLFPALRIGSDLVVRRAEEEMELLREKEFSSLSPDTPRRGGRMEEGLGREERFSGLLVTPSETLSFACLNTLEAWLDSPPVAVVFRLTQERWVGLVYLIAGFKMNFLEGEWAWTSVF